MTSQVQAYLKTIDELQVALFRANEKIAELEKQLADINLLGMPVFPNAPGPKQIIESTGK